MVNCNFINAQRIVSKFVQGVNSALKISPDKFLSGVIMAIKQIKDEELPDDWDFSSANDEPEEEFPGPAKLFDGIGRLETIELMRVLCRE